MRIPVHAAGALVAGLLLAAPLATPAGAQLPSASAAASGLAENYTAVARGAHAPAWNPAGLAMPGNPGWSIVAGGRASAGLAPIGLTDLVAWEGQALPIDVRASWLASIRARGGQRLDGSTGLTPFAMSMGRMAIQFGAEINGHGAIAADAAELVLFGNAGVSDSAHSLSFEGTDFLITSVSTAAMSWAQPLSLRLGGLADQHFAIGATARWIVGNGYVGGRARGTSGTDAGGIDLDLPVVQSDSSLGSVGFEAGRGMGLDLGASWRGGPWTASMVMKNVVNTFAWDMSSFYWRPGTARFGGDTTATDFDARPIATAPDDVRREVAEARYARELAVGGAWRMSPGVLVTADARRRLGEGAMNAVPASHVGVGAELRPVRWVPVRVGAARSDATTRLAGGLGVDLPWLSVAASFGRQFGGGGSHMAGALTVQLGGR